jgi:hypothetical protein
MSRLLDDSGADHPVNTVELTKVSGQTLIAGLNPLDEPPWHWQPRTAGERLYLRVVARYASGR